VNETLEITLRSLWVSGAATLLAAAFGLPLGLWLGTRGRSHLAATFLYAGMGLPPVVVGLFFYFLFSRSGPLGTLGLLYTLPAVIIAESVLAFPLIAGFTMAGVASRFEEVRKLVRSLGGSEAQALLVLLTESRKVIVAALAAGFGAVISEVGAVTIVGGDIRHATRVLTTAVVLETRKGDLELAATLGIILLGVTLVVSGVLVAFGEKR